MINMDSPSRSLGNGLTSSRRTSRDVNIPNLDCVEMSDTIYEHSPQRMYVLKPPRSLAAAHHSPQGIKLLLPCLPPCINAKASNLDLAQHLDKPSSQASSSLVCNAQKSGAIHNSRFLLRVQKPIRNEICPHSLPACDWGVGCEPISRLFLAPVHVVAAVQRNRPSRGA